MNVPSIRSSTHHGSHKALVLMVLDADWFDLDRHIGVASFMKERNIS